MIVNRLLHKGRWNNALHYHPHLDFSADTYGWLHRCIYEWSCL
ncbi:hypothetical protein PAE4_50104 [Bacillus altitudinis]|nr:hypothetical protein PAE4_50104 [Bacillus altitudinis]